MEKPNPVPPPPEERLESWKEIATYLSRDVRTVQRWERGKGLPVRRLPGGDMARVYALKAELDSWWHSRGIHIIPEPARARTRAVQSRRWVWPVAGLALGSAVALGIWRWAAKQALPATHVVPLTSYVGEVRYPSFSPDGKQVVFTWNGPKQDNYDLYVKLVGGGEPFRLTRDPAYDAWAAWSSDGRLIAFVRWQIAKPMAQILLISPLGGAERLLGETFVPEIWPTPAFCWSRDSRWLIAGWPESGTRTNLCRIAVDTGEQHRLATPPQGWWGDDSPVLSPDGRRVAFIRRRGPEQGNVYLLGLTGDYGPKGEPVPLTREACCVANPLWTSDGRQVLYVKHEQDITTLYRIAAVPGSQPEAVRTIGTLGSHLAISPQGEKLAYVSGATTSNLWRVALPRAGIRSAAAPVLGASHIFSSSRIDAMPDFSPDGSKVAFCSNRSGSMEIWIANADGSNERQLTSLGGPQALLPRWSPDGRQIVFYASVERNRDLHIVSVNGGKPRALTNGGINYAASWSRNGNWIYFASDRSGQFQCWRIPSAGGGAVQVTKHGGYGGIESSDGKLLYYAKTFTPGDIWQVPLAGGEESPVHPGVAAFRVPWNFSVTANGIYTAATDNPLAGFQVKLYNPSTQSVETLGRVEKSLGRSMTVSPDGTWLLFQDFPAQRGDLMLVENFR
jgi:eukaryotic-like serine/threonine-protein kinase